MIELKQITIEDLDFARKLRNANRQYFFNTRVVTRKEHLNWFKKGQKGFYIIWLDNTRIGTISLKKHEIGNVIIDKNYRGKGYLREALKKLKIKNVYLKIRPDNEDAIIVYKALGFIEKERVLWK